MSRRGLFTTVGGTFVVGVLAGVGLDRTIGSQEVINKTERKRGPAKEPKNPLEKSLAFFEKMSEEELAAWILDNSGTEATDEDPVKFSEKSYARTDLENTAAGRPAYSQPLLELDGKEYSMEVYANRDILLFRALLIEALRDSSNYFERKPIKVESNHITNRSGSHKSTLDKSHFYGNSMDFSGSLENGGYDSPANRQLGKIIDEIGGLIGVKTSGKKESLERVDSLHGKPGLSKGHYHVNSSNDSAISNAERARDALRGKYTFENKGPLIDLSSATISKAGLNFIHEYEKFWADAYGDAHPGGTITIGYGATYYLKGTEITRSGETITIEGEKEKPKLGDKITLEEADRLSRLMIEKEYLDPVVTRLKKNEMSVTQSQLDALVSYSFHRGPGNVVKLIDRLYGLYKEGYGNDELAVRTAFMYDIDGPVREIFREGVTRRYLDTADIFIGADYQRQHNRPYNPRAWKVLRNIYLPD